MHKVCSIKLIVFPIPDHHCALQPTACVFQLILQRQFTIIVRIPVYLAEMVLPRLHLVKLALRRLRGIVAQLTVVSPFGYLSHPAAQVPFPIGDGQGFFQHFGVGDAGPGGGDLLQAVFQRLDLRRGGVIRAEDGVAVAGSALGISDLGIADHVTAGVDQRQHLFAADGLAVRISLHRRCDLRLFGQLEAVGGVAVLADGRLIRDLGLYRLVGDGAGGLGGPGIARHMAFVILCQRDGLDGHGAVRLRDGFGICIGVLLDNIGDRAVLALFGSQTPVIGPIRDSLILEPGGDVARCSFFRVVICILSRLHGHFHAAIRLAVRDIRCVRLLGRIARARCGGRGLAARDGAGLVEQVSVRGGDSDIRRLFLAVYRPCCSGFRGRPFPRLLRRRGRRGLAGGGGVGFGLGIRGLGHGWVFHSACRWVGGEGGGAEQPDAQAGDQ